MRFVKKLFVFVGCSALLVSYQNCSSSDGFKSTEQSSSSTEIMAGSESEFLQVSELETAEKSNSQTNQRSKNGDSDVNVPNSFVCALEADEVREEVNLKIGVINNQGGWQNTLLEIACVSEETCAKIDLPPYLVKGAVYHPKCAQKAQGYRDFTTEELKEAINQGKAIRAVFPGKLVM